MEKEKRKTEFEMPENFWYPNPLDNSNELHEDSIEIEIYHGVWELIKKLDKID